MVRLYYENEVYVMPYNLVTYHLITNSFILIESHFFISKFLCLKNYILFFSFSIFYPFLSCFFSLVLARLSFSLKPVYINQSLFFFCIK